MSKIPYRREIDGLRAIAVVPIVLFHAGFRMFSGGFVGVDVFFVISGYLITSILLAEMQEGSFTLTRFYARRARRLLPALLVVLLVCIPFAWLWLLPEDLKGFSQSLVSVFVFSSNILFWKTSGGYFDPDADLKPLIHTWSLAVEEQYYILFPLFILLTWRLPRRRVVVSLVVIAVASLALADWASLAKPAAAFFLLPTRAWELLLGALIAFGFERALRAGLTATFGPAKFVAIEQALGALGLAMIAYAIFAFDEDTPFPGRFALVPTVGAALVITFATARTLVGRILGGKLLVGIGLISYSLYLWHQPLFAFARQRILLEPDKTVFMFLAVATVVPAYLTWRFVETPFRRRAPFTLALPIRSVMASIAVSIVGFATLCVVHDGYASRFSPDVLAKANGIHDQNPHSGTCHSLPGFVIAPADSCVLGDGSNVVGLLIGDSEANALAETFGSALLVQKAGVKQVTMAGCPPLFGVYSAFAGLDCYRHNNQLATFLESDRSDQSLVLVSRWTKWIEKDGFDNGEGGIEHRSDHVDIVSDGIEVHDDEAQRRALLKERYQASMERYLRTGKRIILVYPIPEVGFNAPIHSAKLAMFAPRATGAADLTTSYAAYRARNRETIEVLDAIGEHANLVRVRPEAIFCNSFVKDRCVVELDGVLLYADDNHLSRAGARLVVAEIMKRM